MIKVLFIISVLIILFIRISVSNINKKRYGFLLISMYVILISLNFSYSFFSYFTEISATGYLFVDRLGEFGNDFRIYSWVFVIPIGLLLGYKKVWRRKRKRMWLRVTILLVTISLINPMNPFPSSALIFCFFLLQIVISMEYIMANFDYKTIIRGVFDGLLFITFCQLIITILYPILNIEYVATLFKGGALDASLKREGYVSAVGVLGHPGQLAIFCQYSIMFYVSCLMNNYRKRLAQVAILINIFIIIFTYSRTTYATLLLSIIIIYALFRYGKGLGSLISLKSIFALILGLVMFLGILFLTPLKLLFLESNFQTQIGVRLSSWYMGYQVWTDSPILGVGINSHVYYMGHVLNLVGESLFTEFLTTNPIHNIHFLILAETGIIGFLLWLSFLGQTTSNLSKNFKTSNIERNILNLTLVGILITAIFYGLFGWAPFNTVPFMISILFSYLTLSNNNK